jgi:hypothetical protein
VLQRGRYPSGVAVRVGVGDRFRFGNPEEKYGLAKNRLSSK